MMMLNPLRTVGEAVYGLLPKNEHAAAAEKLERKITILKSAALEKDNFDISTILDKAHTHSKSPAAKFVKNFEGIRKTQAEKKEDCEKRLLKLNGCYYQESSSKLKQAWDTLVSWVNTAFGYTITQRGDLDHIPDINSEVTISLNRYKRLEKTRDRIQRRLDKIVSVEKKGPLDADMITLKLIKTKEALEKKRATLCGNHFEDPNGQLRQAWLQAQADPSAQAHFNSLQEESKTIEAQLWQIERQLSLPSDERFDYIDATKDKICKKIATLQTRLTEEKAKIGLWRPSFF